MFFVQTFKLLEIIRFAPYANINDVAEKNMVRYVYYSFPGSTSMEFCSLLFNSPPRYFLLSVLSR